MQRCLMTKKGMLAQVMLGALAISAPRAVAQSPKAEAVASDHDGRFVVGPRSISLPQEFFLLVRKDGKYGAFRLLAIEPGKEPRYGTATYESYLQGDGTGSFLSANVIKKSGEL